MFILLALLRQLIQTKKNNVKIEGQVHEHLINKLQEKVRIALEKAIRKPRSASQTSRESKEPLEGDYLDLERNTEYSSSLGVTKQRLEELIKETSGDKGQFN